METLTAPNPQLTALPEADLAVQVPPSVEVTQYAQQVEAGLAPTVEVPLTSPEAGETVGVSRLRALGRAAVIRAGLEVVGIGVDLALMGVGKAGIGALQSVATREGMATASDLVILDKLNGKDVAAEQVEASRGRKIGRKVVGLTASVGAAIAAQKLGPDLVDMVHSNFNNGVGEVAVPLGSKVAAVTGMGAAQRRIFG